ncbi:hypothetical protein [Hydrogenophaga sp.]|uniref:hypothetical protein n=1 Tax=Hydrogenophaga sp. TaxID=1904254 RepID=UPI0019BA3A44|nr:hypothetical protein [Hydrogenophaga sp.]MBD3893264.1 hypothetical protein [Hydrogenophaga sp.]
MRAAPSVRYPVRPCLFYAGLLGLLAALGLLILLFWTLAPPAHGRLGSSLAGLALWLAWAGLAWRSWRQSPVGQLHWDAQASAGASVPGCGWRWLGVAEQDDMALQRVQLVLDLQSRALLRLHRSDQSGSWVWVERASDPARWSDLRRALLAQRPHPAQGPPLA